MIKLIGFLTIIKRWCDRFCGRIISQNAWDMLFAIANRYEVSVGLSLIIWYIRSILSKNYSFQKSTQSPWNDLYIYRWCFMLSFVLPSMIMMAFRKRYLVAVVYFSENTFDLASHQINKRNACNQWNEPTSWEKSIEISKCLMNLPEIPTIIH